MIVDDKYLYFVVFLTSCNLFLRSTRSNVYSCTSALNKRWMFQKLFNLFTGCTLKSKLMCTLQTPNSSISESCELLFPFVLNFWKWRTEMDIFTFCERPCRIHLFPSHGVVTTLPDGSFCHHSWHPIPQPFVELPFCVQLMSPF